MVGRFLGLFFLLLFLVSCSFRSVHIFSDVLLPHIGLVELGETQVGVINSPLIRAFDKPGEVAVISKEAGEEWKKVADQKWLSVVLKNPPILEIAVPEIPPKPPFNYSYSIYVSRRSAVIRGFLLGPNSRVNFAYFTINIDGGELEKIEARREWLKQKVKIREKIRLRGKLVRFETTATDLFEKTGERIIEFVDFYLADIEFLN